MTRRWLAVTLVAGLACSGGRTDAPPAEIAGALPEGVVAQVGSQSVTGLTVARIADAQGLSLEKARERAIEDALLAAGAEEHLGGHAVQRARARVLAKAMLRQLWLDTREAPISPEELAEATDHYWTEYDRPPAHRAVHAVIMPADAKPADSWSPADRSEARRQAERVLEAVKPAAELAQTTQGTWKRDQAAVQFEKLAKAVVLGGPVRMQCDDLPPITEDGYGVVEGVSRRSASTFDKDFTAGLWTLRKRGDLSGIVETRFGYHVILLLEVLPEKRASEAERREKLKDEILRVRGVRAKRRLLKKLREDARPEVVSNQDALLSQIRITSDEARAASEVDALEGFP